MVQRFLFNGINTKATRSAVGCQNDVVPFPRSHKTQSALPVTKLAKSWTHFTSNSPVRHHAAIRCVSDGYLTALFLSLLFGNPLMVRDRVLFRNRVPPRNRVLFRPMLGLGTGRPIPMGQWRSFSRQLVSPVNEHTMI
jgi:hypothetical protein